MQQTGVLILTCPVRSLAESLGNHLATASKQVSKRLYIKLEPGQDKLHPPLKRQVSDLSLLYKFIPTIYTKASTVCETLDVRLLLTSFKNPTFVENRLSSTQIDLAFTDSSDSSSSVKQYVNEQFQRSCLHVVKLNKLLDEGNNFIDNENLQMYNTIILGGTFDRLHNGHKILLSAAVSRATQKLIVGVTCGAMLKKKDLWELIEPLEERTKNVLDFLNDIDPSIFYSVVPIYDPFGPAIDDPNIDCVVVSQETRIGGMRINEERVKKIMKPLDILQINLLDDPNHIKGYELKISSSNIRRKLLGTFLRKSEPKSISSRPFCIALVGGSMNGKSTICQYLHSLGAFIINTYEIVTEILVPSSIVFQEICKVGFNILGPNNEVQLKKFLIEINMDKAKRELAKSILLPAVKDVVESKITKLPSGLEGTVVVVKMAEFLYGDWQNDFHHIWVSIMPEQQRILKFKQFYQITDSEVAHMLSIQPSNEEFVKIAHAVFSPQWDADSTKHQVEAAFEKLKVWNIAQPST